MNTVRKPVVDMWSDDYRFVAKTDTSHTHNMKTHSPHIMRVSYKAGKTKLLLEKALTNMVVCFG